jgi:hypothetical protein
MGRAGAERTGSIGREQRTHRRSPAGPFADAMSSGQQTLDHGGRPRHDGPAEMFAICVHGIDRERGTDVRDDD